MHQNRAQATLMPKPVSQFTSHPSGGGGVCMVGAQKSNQITVKLKWFLYLYHQKCVHRFNEVSEITL